MLDLAAEVGVAERIKRFNFTRSSGQDSDSMPAIPRQATMRAEQQGVHPVASSPTENVCCEMDLGCGDDG